MRDTKELVNMVEAALQDMQSCDELGRELRRLTQEYVMRVQLQMGAVRQEIWKLEFGTTDFDRIVRAHDELRKARLRLRDGLSAIKDKDVTS